MAGALLTLLGHRHRGAILSDQGLRILGGKAREISFAQLSGPARITRSLGFNTLSLALDDGADVKLVGIRPEEARNLAAGIEEGWRRHFTDEFARHRDDLHAVSAVVRDLERPQRYASACLLEPYRLRAEKALAGFPDRIPEGVLPSSQQDDLAKVIDFHKAPDQLKKAASDRFLGVELQEMRDFFDSIESNPLTPEQRLAVATDEDATLVLAGAGSGKTSVIVAKAAYLIRRHIREPQEILLMAFGKGAAAEMAGRIKERTGEEVDALTFHALGYSIIRDVEHGTPALAPHASDDKQFGALLRDILVTEVLSRPKSAALLIKWFSGFFWPYKSEWDFETRDAYYQYVENHELRTLQGELVRSFEEWEIANWLYLNAIAYEYEPDYEHVLPKNNRKAYTPDFRLIESGVYIEHFGVRKARGPGGERKLTTAPHVDREEYLEGMAWKRGVHREYGTTLVETFSYEREEGRLTEALAEKLAPYATPNPIPSGQVFERLSEMGQVDAFTQTVGTFLRHLKSSGTSVEQCRSRAETSKDKARNRAFLEVFEPVLEAYQERLGDRIDFEDMIVRATELVSSGRYKSPYRHLLVDEFQDISEGRARLLMALKSQHNDARIFAVGDDWQSIYRFTGSDIHLMRNFGREFGGTFAGKKGVHSTVDLGRTFRSVDKIAGPARSFVLKNPAQITKRVTPASTTPKPAIKVAYYGWGEEASALTSALDDIKSSASGKATSALLLGRYHFVKPDNLAHLKSSYPSLSLRFMTVHASKGLEADHVVILRAGSGRMGFPSEIVDDPVLDLVLPEPEAFDHAEERRLFYVALTRARSSVTVLADLKKPSAFARELVENPEYEVLQIGAELTTEHRCPACGGRMLAKTSKKGRAYFQCEHQHLCGEILRPCSACGKDIPVADKAHPETLVCSCGATFPACPACDEGWLVQRTGRYGDFLGCIRYPDCTGKARTPKSATSARNRRRRTG